MRVKFDLQMYDLVVESGTDDCICLDFFGIEWEGDHSEQEILEMSQTWISSQNFLTSRMTGLVQVGESTLTIEPLSGPEQKLVNFLA